MAQPNRRRMGTQLGRRTNRAETDDNWAAEEQRNAKKDEIPPGHGRIVREEPETNVVAVKPPASHVDAEGNEVAPYRQINQATDAPEQHGAGHAIPTTTVPAHQIGAPAPRQGAQTPGGHGDPRLSPNSEPRPMTYRIQASTTNPAGAQAVDPQQGMQSMAQRAQPQGGVHRVGGQPGKPMQQGMPVTVRSVAGDVSQAQAAQMLQAETQGIAPGTSQFQGRPSGQPAADAGRVAPQQVVQPGQSLPPGAQVVQQNEQVTISIADDETIRREMEAAGMQDRLPIQQRTTIGRRGPAEQVGAAPRIDVTVVLSAFTRPALLEAQVDALRKGTRIPATVMVLAAADAPVADALAAGSPWVEHGPLPHNLYGIPTTPWERFFVAQNVSTKYVCILDDDCVPGAGWLEACVDAMEHGLDAVIAACGHRLGEDGCIVASRGPVFHPSGTVVADDLGDAELAALVDVGDLGWFFKTEWMTGLAASSLVNQPPYGWQLHACAALLLDQDPVPTVVLPYTHPDTWGALRPPMEDGLRTLENMDAIRRQVFDVYRAEGWMLVSQLPEDQRAITLPSLTVENPEAVQKPPLPPGAYENKRLGRYITLEDPQWSAEHYELVTGQVWHHPSDSPLPPAAPEGGPVAGATKIPAHKDGLDAYPPGLPSLEDAARTGEKMGYEAKMPQLDAQSDEVTLSPQLDTSVVESGPEGTPAPTPKKDAPGTLGRAPEGAASAAAPPEPEPGPPPVVADVKPAIIGLSAGEHKWCACGQSKNGPLCDGSHEGTPFTPLTFELKENKPKVVLCQCKATKTAPYCDGRGHAKVAAEQQAAEQAKAKAVADAE